MAEEQSQDISELYSHFMSYSVLLEAYLLKGHSLTNLQADAISATIYSLRTSLDAWRKKHG
jgi:hypothetical protein